MHIFNFKLCLIFNQISAFITAGPINSAISRLGSLYLYQWSFSLAFTLISRFIACGLLFALSISVVAGVPVILAHDAYDGVIFVSMLQFYRACIIFDKVDTVLLLVCVHAFVYGFFI